jgi:hypothetical protein
VEESEMKKTIKEQLRLNKETIRAMRVADLRTPAGGLYTAVSQCLQGNCGPHNETVDCP